MSEFRIYLIYAFGNIAYVLLFYPIIFLVFKTLRKETLPAAGHFFGFFATWILVSVPGFLFGQGFYEWHPTVPLVVPTVAAVLAVAIALSLFGQELDQTPKKKVKQIDETEKKNGEEMEQSSNQNDEDFFALAWDEIENQTVNKGLWARAFADAGGDSEKTKSIYLGLRAQQLDYERAPLTGHEENE